MKIGDILLGCLLLFGTVQTYRVSAANARADREAMRGDSLAVEIAAARIDSAGFDVRFSTVTDSLGALLLERDTAYAVVVRELTTARARIRDLLDVNAGASGTVGGTGTMVDTVFAPAPPEVAEMIESSEWRGEVDDGLLSGLWSFRLPSASFRLDYDVDIPGEIVLSQGGDGRTLVSARALDPRARLTIENAVVQPLPPVVERRTSWTERFISFGLGALAGLVAN